MSKVSSESLAAALALLSTLPPPAAASVKLTVPEANARIVELEKQLGVKHGLPVFNSDTAARRVAHLESLLEAREAGELDPAAITALAPLKGMPKRPHSKAPAAPAVLSAVPAPVAALPALPPAPEPTVTLQNGILRATLAGYIAMDKGTREQFCRDGGRLAPEDFEKLPLAAKSEFGKNGGRILDVEGSTTGMARCTAAKSFGAK